MPRAWRISESVQGRRSSEAAPGCEPVICIGSPAGRSELLVGDTPGSGLAFARDTGPGTPPLSARLPGGLRFLPVLYLPPRGPLLRGAYRASIRREPGGRQAYHVTLQGQRSG